MAEGNFNKVPYITGVTKNEGIILTSSIHSPIEFDSNSMLSSALIGPGNQRNMDTFNLDPINAIRHFLSIEKEQIGREVAQLVHDEYLTTSRSYATQINELERVCPYSILFHFQYFTRVLTAFVGLGIFQTVRVVCRLDNRYQ